METLVRHPATQSAARLTGCRNFLPARRCEGGIRLDGWDILLPLHAVGERATVSVPDGAITVEGGTHTARVSRVIRDLNATAVVLRATEAPDAPPLCVVLPEGVRAAEGDTLSFRSSRTVAGFGRNDRRANMKSRCRTPIKQYRQEPLHRSGSCFSFHRASTASCFVGGARFSSSWIFSIMACDENGFGNT